MRGLLDAVPADPGAAERPLANLSRFLLALGVALESVADRIPLVFSEGQSVRTIGGGATDRFHVDVERVAMQVHLLAHEAQGIATSAELSGFRRKVSALLDDVALVVAEKPLDRQRMQMMVA
ncbi:hypothetical protein L6R52_42985 [Myxococcota bacterium]|nr:hypothetical protein [Myxococcota bacterium]